MDINEEERDLRKALQYDILNIVLQQDATSGMRTTTGAIRALTELVWQYMHHAMIPDLVAFSNHAKSRTISTDDVGLILRKLPDKLEQFQRQFPTNGGGAGRANTAMTASVGSRPLMNSGRRSLPMSPSATSGKQRRPITTHATTNISTNATNNHSKERDREREYQDLLLASSDDDNDDNRTNSSKGPLPSKKSGDLELASDSMSSDESDHDTDKNTEDTNKVRRTTRHSYPPTATIKRSFDQQRTRQVLQDISMNETSVENGDGRRTASSQVLTPRTSDDICQKRTLPRATSSDDDEAPIMAPKMRKLQKRQAIEDDDDEDDEKEQTLKNPPSLEKLKHDDLEDSPSSPAHPPAQGSGSRTTVCRPKTTKEPVKSQVAEILADLSYDSGPESTDPASRTT